MNTFSTVYTLTRKGDAINFFPALIIFGLVILLSPQNWRVRIFTAIIIIGGIGVLLTPRLFISYDGPSQTRLHLSQVWPTVLPALALLCFTMGLRFGAKSKVASTRGETTVSSTDN